MKTDKALWQAINAHNLDVADAVLPFSRRLARETGWSHPFCQAAIADYKRFIYLICVADRMLAPSDIVDEVWHLHLIYTRDYWDVFCTTVLGRKIHHGPTRGGTAEADRYLGAYRHTLDLYRREFGEPPPATWPDDQTRFSKPIQWQRLNPSDHIILPKRQVFLCLALALPLLLASCSAKKVIHVIEHNGFFLIFGALMCWLVATAMLQSMGIIKPGNRKGGGDGGCGSGCGSSGDRGCGSGCGSGCGGGCGGGCGS